MNVAACGAATTLRSARKRRSATSRPARSRVARARILTGRPVVARRARSYDLAGDRLDLHGAVDAHVATRRGRLAVVVLTHNRVHLLRKCVENVLLRTSRATREIVIWNNASTDGTAEYLDSLDDPRIRVVRSEREHRAERVRARRSRLTTAPYLRRARRRRRRRAARVGRDAARRVRAAAHDRVPGGRPRGRPARRGVARSASRRPHEYTLVEENGVRLLRGPAGGGCAITSRELNERVGGFRQDKKHVFWLEDEAYIDDIERLGFGAAVLADLRVHHTGGPHYTKASEEKVAYWKHYDRRRARRATVKRAFYRIPFIPRANTHFGWFQPPSRSDGRGTAIDPGDAHPTEPGGR